MAAQNHVPSSQNPFAVAGVLFDLDGTIIDYETISHQALERALQANKIVKEEYLDKLSGSDKGKLPWSIHGAIVGMKDEDWSKNILKLLGIPEDVMTWKQFVDGYVRELGFQSESIDSSDTVYNDGETLITSVKPWSDVEKLLSYFRDELKVPICIATSSPRKCFIAKMNTTEMREKVLRYFFPKDSPQEHAALNRKPYKPIDIDSEIEYPNAAHDTTLFTTGDEIPFGRGKPNPDIFLEAAKKIGVDPKNCIVFEDSPHGIRAGFAAGCKTVALPDKRFFENGKLKLAEGVPEPTWNLPEGIASFLKEVVEKADIVKYSNTNAD